MAYTTLEEVNKAVIQTPGVLFHYQRLKKNVLSLLQELEIPRIPDQLVVMYVQNREVEFYPYISKDDPFRIIEYYNVVTNHFSQYMLIELLLHHDILDVVEAMAQERGDDDAFFTTLIRYPLHHKRVPLLQNMIHKKPSRYKDYIVRHDGIDPVYKNALAHASTSEYQSRTTTNKISYKMPSFYHQSS